MIGKLYWVIMPFFDIINQKNSFKKRPALVIAKADDKDVIILPVSTITHKDNLNAKYDIEIDPSLYNRIKLQKICYVRTHKQTVVHIASLGGIIGDIKTDYQDLYLDIFAKRDEFNEEINKQACS